MTDVCAEDVSGLCWLLEKNRELCSSGVTQIKTSGGLSVLLYSDKSTEPSIYIKHNNALCKIKSLVCGIHARCRVCVIRVYFLL